MITNRSLVQFSADTTAPLIGPTATASQVVSGTVPGSGSVSFALTVVFDRSDVVTELYFEQSNLAGRWYCLTATSRSRTTVPSSIGDLAATIFLQYSGSSATITILVSNPLAGSGATLTPTTFNFRAETFSNVFS